MVKFNRAKYPSMNLTSYIQQSADQIGGQYTDYDHTKSVVVVPIDGTRFQTVLAMTQTSAVSGRDQATFSATATWFQSTTVFSMPKEGLP